MDWFIWRVATDKRIASSLIEIETQWSINDVLDAHETLDALDAAGV